MNGRPHASAAAAAAAVDALDTGWFGGSSIEAAPGSVEQPTGPPEREAHGWLSWLFWGGSDRRSTRRMAASRTAKPGPAQRQRANSAGSAAPRLPRPASTPKLHTAASGGLTARSRPQQAQQQPAAAGGQTALPAGQPMQGGAPAGSEDAAAAAKRAAAHVAQARSSLGQKAGSRASLVKQANYAERRQAWRQRIEAIKAKQASRAAAGGHALPPEAAAAAHSAGRVFSKHVAIPLPAGSVHGSRSGSTHSTPYGSPSRRELLSDAAGAALPQLEAPPAWQGFQTSEAPPDLAAASEEQLRRFLQQAGWAAEAALALPDREALVGAARSARGAWEVERIMACTWPEEVLRVPRKCRDPALLKTAWRRCSMAVHPDKCSAVGASDAMSILTDCYTVLSAAAASGRAPAAVPAFMRQAHPARQPNGGSSSNLAGTATAAAASPAAAAPPASESGAASGGTGSSPGPGSSQPPPRRQTADAAAQGRHSPLPPGLPRQGSGRAQHSRHASAESFFAADAPGPAAWPSGQPDPEQQGPQHEHVESALHPARTTSSEAPLLGPHGSGGTSQDHHHWNPHSHFSSDEAEAIAAAAAATPAAPASAPAADAAATADAAAAWSPTQLAVPLGAARSRSSSSSSMSAAMAAAAAAAGGTPPPRPMRSSSGSLAGSSSGTGSSPVQPEGPAEGAPMSRPSSGSSLAGATSRPPSPAAAAGMSGANLPGVAAAAANGGRSSPEAAQGPNPNPASRPGSAMGGQQPAPVGRAKPGPAGGLAAGSGKIRVTLKVRPKA
ncbi:hypothetical protein ABPG75_013734 [Micractinium tetrahymenae]